MYLNDIYNKINISYDNISCSNSNYISIPRNVFYKKINDLILQNLIKNIQ